jgi:hypothetical protein
MKKRITIWSESELMTYIDIYNLDSVTPSWKWTSPADKPLTAHVSYKWVLGDFVRLNRRVHLLQIRSISEMQYPDRRINNHPKGVTLTFEQTMHSSEYKRHSKEQAI